MTKTIVWLGLVFLLILGACVCSQIFIDKSSAAIGAALTPLDGAAQRGDWPETRAVYDRAKAGWEKAEKLWKMILDHEEIRDIEAGFVELGKTIELEDGEQTGQKLAALLFYLHRVPENRELSPENIL